MIKNSHTFDVVIIGAGPSGIFTALELIHSGLKTALIDKGGDFYSRLRSNTKDLCGFGGAAMRYDSNLDYSNGLPKESNLGARVFQDRRMAEKYISRVYDKLYDFGLKKEKSDLKKSISKFTSKLQIIDRGIISIGETESRSILKNIYDHLVSNGITFYEYSEVKKIIKNQSFQTTVLNKTKEVINIVAKNVVLATGKLSINESRDIFNSLGIDYKVCDSIDLGVRIETLKSNTEKITEDCINPKIILEDNVSSTRTFCWCPGGKVISYNIENMSVLDGQHCHDDPQTQSNFGIVSTIKLPQDVDGTRFGMSYVKTINEYTKFKPGLQILKDFINGSATMKSDLEKNNVRPSLGDYTLVDLSSLMFFSLKENILKLIKKINEVFPGSIGLDALVYGPVIEKNFPEVTTNLQMETNVEGFYVVGDVSGKAIGIITGAAMGFGVANTIIKKYENKF